MTKPLYLLPVGLALLAASSAYAKDRSLSDPLAALTACRAVVDNAARLACYDQASARFGEAVSKGDVIVMDQEEAQRTRRSLFGFSVPKIRLFRGDDGEEAQKIDAVIASATALGYDKYRIRLEDGAVWQTTEASPALTVKAGQKIEIKRASMGSYFLRVSGQRSVRGMRVN
ncbi:hypothetical protein [Sphingosinicella sp. BN140058]|uniref:hypothetical protein n=1 Tax=Sphingosinicella sp. BN140058 TaxID=1892855 RepID=UPI0010109221|nr:hypothetical protein [Sphingosinicella sp. BN140058]QAY77093.1 hypothetical protein ETR14_11725 [Sphingosinicella sp. BN140058]